MSLPSGKPVSPTIRLTCWLLITLFAIIVIGSWFARTEIVARGQGKVIPSGRVQVVQPKADGEISEILVHEGQRVQAGAVLIRLDATEVRGTIKRIEADIDRRQLEADIARAIIEPLSTSDPSGAAFISIGRAAFQRLRPESLEPGAEALVVSTLTASRDQVIQYDAQLDRIERSQKVRRARLEKSRADQAIVEQRFVSSETLRKTGTISQFDYLGRVRERDASRGEVAVAERELDELVGEQATAASQRAGVISMALTTNRKQLNDATITLKSLEAELAVARARLANLSLDAPVAGRVERLSVFTIGGFVEAGQTLMTIVPADQKIEIEAFFDNRDVGFLETGQQAFVKFDAFPSERYGIINGSVASVGADARGDVVAGQWVYAARLALDQDHIQLPNRTISFVPGMTVTVDVITGQRRLISYFFEPILKAIQDGFGER